MCINTYFGLNLLLEKVKKFSESEAVMKGNAWAEKSNAISLVLDDSN